MSGRECELVPSRTQMNRQPGVGSAARMSLLAEYALMLLTVHAAFCGLIRLPVVAAYPFASVGMVASTWIVVRTIRAVRIGWFCPVVTLCIAAAVQAWDGLPEQGSSAAEAASLFSGGAFSPFVLLVMLGMVMCGDVAEWVRRTSENSRLWNRAGEFVLRHGLRLLIYGIGGFIAVYTLVVPLFQEWIFQLSDRPSDPKFAMDRLTLTQNMLFKFSESVSGMWFFVVGTCVGSFLNVVIYRVPAGLSVVAKASHCPGCQQAIRGRDNLPLIGWLKLQGRCRNCQINISSRYPTVELTVGLMFLLLYFVELISGGANLPGRSPNQYAGVLWILFYTKWDLVGLYVFHCFVMSALFSWAMIRHDGHRVPLKSIVITLILVISAVMLQPHLLPLTYNAADVRSIANTFTTLGVGMMAACLLCGTAMLTRRFCQWPDDPMFVSWLLLGLALGWQAVGGVLLILAVWALLRTVSRITTDHPSVPMNSTSAPMQPTSLLFPAAVLLHHGIWRHLVSFFDAGVTS